MAFEGLDISISGDSAGAKGAIASVKSSLGGLERSANSAKDSVEEVGDAATRSSTSLSALGATAGASALSLVGLTSATSGSTASMTALAASTGTVTVALTGLAAVAAPLAATVGTVAAAAGGLATAFGAVVGSGLLAFGEERGEQNAERLEQVNEQIAKLEELEDTEEGLTEQQTKRLETLEEEADKLEETTGIAGGLADAFSDLKEEIAPLITELGEQFIPLIEDAIDALPTLVESVIDALGPLDEFKEALRDFGAAALDIIPEVVEALVDLGRRALPFVRDLAEAVMGGATEAFRAMIEVAQRVGDDLLGVADAAGDLIPELTEIGVAIIETVAPAVESLLEGFDELLSQLIDFGRSETASDAFQRIRARVEPLIEGLIDFANSREVAEIWAAIRQEIVPLIPRVVDLAGELRPLTETLIDNLPEIINGFSAFADSVLDLAEFAIPPLVDAGQVLINVIGDLSQGYAEWVEASEESEADLKEDINGIRATFTSVANKIRSAWSYLTGTGEGSLYGDVRAGFERLREYFASTFHLGALENAFNAAVSGIGDAFDRLNFSGFESALDSVADGVRSLITSLNDLAGVDIDVDVPTFDELLDEARSLVDPAPQPEPEPDPGGDDDDDNTTGDVDPGGQNPDERDGVGDDRQGVDDDPAGTVGAGGTDAHTGGFIASGGPVTLAAGERVLPPGQVTDRGRAELAPSSVADGFDESATGSAIVSELRQLRQAVESDATVSDRDLVRGLERLFDRHNGSL